MKRLAATALLAVGLAGGASEAAARTRLPEIVPGVHGELVLPENGLTPRAVLIILHGIEGPRPIYRSEGRRLAAEGFAVLVLDYYAKAPRGVWTKSQRIRRWAACQAALERAVSYVRSRADLPAERIGLIGFSQGAAVALTTVPRLQEVDAVVDYFGPEPGSWYVARFMRGGETPGPSFWVRVPPTLILHGALDPIVPVGHARRLEEALRTHGREVHLLVYPREMHGLHNPSNGLSRATDTADDARERVREFLDRHFAAIAAR